MHRYRTYNGPMPTTSAFAAVATGTSTKTMLQLATPSTRQLQVISWGFSLSGAPGAAGIVELIGTDVAATVTAHVASGIYGVDPNVPASLLTLGTSATGYTASSEGTPTATRLFDAKEITSVAGGTDLAYEYQFMPDERPVLNFSKFLRVRATTPSVGVNLITWVCWDE